jgi:hypothetical protein
MVIRDGDASIVEHGPFGHCLTLRMGCVADCTELFGYGLVCDTVPCKKCAIRFCLAMFCFQYIALNMPTIKCESRILEVPVRLQSRLACGTVVRNYHLGNLHLYIAVFLLDWRSQSQRSDEESACLSD